jgi:protein FrlC
VGGFRIAACNAQYTRLPFSAFLETQKKLGVSDIEFIAQVPHLWCDHIACEDEAGIASALKAAGIEIAAFTPRLYRYSAYAARSSRQRACTMAYMREAVKIASSLSAPVFCIENGGACFDAPHEELWANCREMLAELCDMAGEAGLIPAIGAASPDDSPILTTAAELERMKDEIGHKKCGVILDTWLASMAGETIGEWFRAFGSDVVLVRFADGNYNGYRPWGEGCLPCGRFLEQIERGGYNGVLSQRRKGETEVSNPAAADERNHRYLSQRLGRQWRR